MVSVAWKTPSTQDRNVKFTQSMARISTGVGQEEMQKKKRVVYSCSRNFAVCSRLPGVWWCSGGFDDQATGAINTYLHVFLIFSP